MIILEAFYHQPRFKTKDALPYIIFNLALEKVDCDANVNARATILIRSCAVH